MSVTATAIRTQALTQLSRAEPVLYETGPSRQPQTDFGRATIAKACSLMSNLSRREIAYFLKLRTKAAVDQLIADFDSGVYDTHPGKPKSYIDASNFVNQVATGLAQPQPLGGGSTI